MSNVDNGSVIKDQDCIEGGVPWELGATTDSGEDSVDLGGPGVSTEHPQDWDDAALVPTEREPAAIREKAEMLVFGYALKRARQLLSSVDVWLFYNPLAWFGEADAWCKVLELQEPAVTATVDKEESGCCTIVVTATLRGEEIVSTRVVVTGMPHAGVR